jgi:hypothetical protein
MYSVICSICFLNWNVSSLKAGPWSGHFLAAVAVVVIFVAAIALHIQHLDLQLMYTHPQ